MSCCEDNAPSCSTTTRPKARKEHRCAECHDTIRRGETYVRTTGVWDGTPDSYALCTTCEAWIAAYFKATRAHDLCDCWTIGSFGEALTEYQVEIEDKLREQERAAKWTAQLCVTGTSPCYPLAR